MQHLSAITMTPQYIYVIGFSYSSASLLYRQVYVNTLCISSVIYHVVFSRVLGIHTDICRWIFWYITACTEPHLYLCYGCVCVYQVQQDIPKLYEVSFEDKCCLFLENSCLVLHARILIIYVSKTYCIILIMEMYIDDFRVNVGIIQRDLCNNGIMMNIIEWL